MSLPGHNDYLIATTPQIRCNCVQTWCKGIFFGLTALQYGLTDSNQEKL